MASAEDTELSESEKQLEEDGKNEGLTFSDIVSS